MRAERADELIAAIKEDRWCEARDVLVHALMRDEIAPEAATAYRGLLEQTGQLTASQVDELRGTRVGDVVADTISQLQAIDSLAQPMPARGWRATVRVELLLLVPAAAFFVTAYSSHSLSGAAVCAGLAAAIAFAFNWFFLGGRPESRHAVEYWLSRDGQCVAQEIGRKVGPPPASLDRTAEAVSLARAEVAAFAGKGDADGDEALA